MIGVFGDSYATPSIGHAGGLEHASWINNLGEPAVSHGSAATSQLWSYRQFLENHEKYDRVVFIMTNSGRFDHAGDNKDWSGIHAIPNLEKVKQILKEETWSFTLLPKGLQEDPHKWNIPRVRACREYILHLEDNIADNLKSQLIKEGILARRPDALIIPLGEFHDLENWTYLPKGTTCWQYSCLQVRSLFADQPDVHGNIYKHYDERRCPNHFTPEINLLFASHVRRALDGEGWQYWGINHIPFWGHQHPWDYYYEPLVKK